MSHDFLIYVDQDRKLDVLFIVDNSPSTTLVQAALARSFDEFHGNFETTHYRVAFVSAQSGHPACVSEDPERVGFTSESCLDRASQFTVGPVDHFEDICANHCDWSTEELEFRATKIAEHDELKSRPWVEFSARRTNIGPDLEIGDALACLAPPGLVDCPYSTPLESMYQALQGSADPESEHYGFLREDAGLMLIFLTTQADCSTNPALQGATDAFAPDNSTFWSSSTSGPTAAICWNAGVDCHASRRGGFAECVPAQHNILGEGVEAEDPSAVLAPLSRYTDLLDELVAERRDLTSGYPAVSVVLLGGIDAFGDEPSYPLEETEPWFSEYGVAPGCTSEWFVLGDEEPELARVTATPPVRLQYLAERYPMADEDERYVAGYSICGEPDVSLSLLGYTEQWTDISNDSTPYEDPTICFPACVADHDLETAWVDPVCEVTRRAGGQRIPVPECRKVTVEDDEYGNYEEYETDDDWQYVMPNDDVDACVVLQGDAGAFAYPATSLDQSDDLEYECGDLGLNLSFELEVRSGRHIPRHSEFYARCLLDPQPEAACPYMVGAR